jgi:SulP family sulfate permease
MSANSGTGPVRQDGPKGAPSERFPHLVGDLRGAFASLLVGLPYSITSGMLAFAPLGPEYLAGGIAAGIASSAVVGIAAALAGGTSCQINGPRASVALLMAGMGSAIATHSALAIDGTPGVPKILGIAMLCIALSGVLQVAFGLLRFGAIVRFLPYPVISGFMVALGLLVAWPQVPAFLGAAGNATWSNLAPLAEMRWGAVAVGLTTVVLFVASRSLFPKAPAPLVGLLAGTALHYLLRESVGIDAVGIAGADTLAGGVLPPHPWAVPEIPMDSAAAKVVFSVLPMIATIAFIGSVESLLSSSVLSIASQMRYDGNRELVSQGVSNLAVAAVGGVVSCGAPFRGVANFAAGGRTRLSGALHSAMAIPLLLLALPFLLRIPIAALAAVLMVAGWDVMTTWRKRLAACPKPDLIVGLLVMAATLTLGTVPAVLFGVICAMFLYVRDTSRAPLRGHYDGSVRLSTRIRTEEHTAYLKGLGSAIRVVEAQGSLFFGTADRFGHGVEELASTCRHLIIDMRRVHDVDPTGALVLAQTMRRLGDRGIRTAIAAVSPGGRRGSAMTRAGVDKAVPLERWFEDVDRALEHAEDIELGNRWPNPRKATEMPLPAMDICAGLSPAETAELAKYLRREVVPAGATVFREGDPGDRLYLLARGEITVSVRLPGKEGRTRRLGTYCPGVVLGEMAVLEGQKRSADGVAVTECVLHTLDSASLEAMRREAPSLHGHLMLNLTRQLIVRLRRQTLELRAAYS